MCLYHLQLTHDFHSFLSPVFTPLPAGGHASRTVLPAVVPAWSNHSRMHPIMSRSSATATGSVTGAGVTGPAGGGATCSSSSLYYSLTGGSPAPLAPPSQLCLVCIPDRGSRTASVLNTYDTSSSGDGGASSSATLVYPDRFTHSGLYSVSGEQLDHIISCHIMSCTMMSWISQF